MRFRRRQPLGDIVEAAPVTAEQHVCGVGISTDFGGHRVLDGVDITVPRGSVSVILGPSGCGKTTLLRHLSGMLRPSRGRVTIQGDDIYGLSPKQLDQLRRRMGFSFQASALLNSMSVLDNVELPLAEAGSALPRGVRRQVARMKLEMVGLLDAADLPPAELSGGMKKRAAIARAVVLDPELVFFDEPSAGLDPITAAGVDNLILKLNKIFGITMIVVTHDIASAFTIADHMMLLLDGRVHATGTPGEVRAWQDDRVQDFIHRALPSEETRGVDLVDFLAT